MPTFSSTLPNITSVDQLAEFIGVSEFELKRLCLRSKSFYHTFERKKKSGHGVRTICAPNTILKSIQRKIKADILDRVDLHAACMGYRRGYSIVNNAQAHVGQRFILNMDIQDFFGSINSSRVAGLFVALGYNEEVAIVLAKLSCYQNALPQGAPSSPAIANLVCHKLDRRLQGLAHSKDLKYTRYCDDITFSGSVHLNQSLIKLLQSILNEEGFSVNNEKTRLLTRRSCQTVTGLTVNTKVSVPRRKRRLIRAAFHRATCGQKKLEDIRRSHLDGMAAFINMVKLASMPRPRTNRRQG